MPLTTPIYYVNGDPHIGHAYTSVMGDIVKRALGMHGDGIFFTTGTDEHGQKNEECAKLAGLQTQRFLDQQSLKFKALFDRLGITYDVFVRTTEKHHIAAVTRALNNLKDQFVKKDYTGLYCVGCEQFKKVTDLNAAGECPDHAKKPETRTESNWFFPLEPYRKQLIEYLEFNENWIRPIQYTNEVRNMLKEPLEDLCISRPKSRLKLGIELPFDRDYVTYVWFDALMNYLSSQFYPHNHTGSWPGTVHLIGKDILKTHAVYWPIMLIALGESLPKRIEVHAHWLGAGKVKMAKSLGNVVDPNEVIDEFGVDALRYYLARRGSMTHDSEITKDLIKDLYHTELANGVGNLLSRSAKLCQSAFNGYPEDDALYDDVFDEVKKTLLIPLQYMGDIAAYTEAAYQACDAVNVYFNDAAPWKLLKEGKRDEASLVLRTTLQCVTKILQHLRPIIPEGAERGLKLIGVETHWGGPADCTVFDIGTGLFQRIV